MRLVVLRITSGPRVLKSLVVYAAYRSKAVVLVLFLLCMPCGFATEFFHVALVLVFLSVLFSMWSPHLANRGLVYVLLVHLFVYLHALICPFSLPLGARSCDCGTPWTFLFPFLFN